MLKLELFLPKIIKFFLFLTPFSFLLYYPNLFYPVPVSNIFVFSSLIILIFFLSLIYFLFLKKKIEFKKNRLFPYFLFFFLIYFLIFIFSGDKVLSLISPISRESGINILFFFFLYPVFLFLFFEKKDWINFFKFIIFSGIIVLIFSFKDIYLNFLKGETFFRINSIFKNPIFLSLYYIFYIYLILFIFSYAKNLRIEKYFYIFLLILSFIALFFTGSRGAFLAIFISFIFIFLIWFYKKNKRIFLIFLFFLISLIWIFPYLKNLNIVQENSFLDRYLNISIADTVESRLYVWELAYESFLEKPFLGWGQNNFIYAFDKNYLTDLYEEEFYFDKPHNFLFDLLIEGGIILFLAYWLMILALIYFLFKSKNLKYNSKIILLGLLIAYHLAIFSSFNIFVTYFFFFMFLGFFFFVFSEEKEKNILNLNYLRILLFLIMFIFALFLYKINFSLFSFNKDLYQFYKNDFFEFDKNKKSLLENDGKKQADKMLAKFKDIFDKDIFYKDYLFYDLSIIYFLGFLNDSSLNDKEKIDFILWFEQKLLDDFKKSPRSSEFYLLLIKFYLFSGFEKIADEYWEELIKKYPNRLHFYSFYSKLLKKKNKEKAIQILKRGLEFSNNNEEYLKEYLELINKKSTE